MEAATIQSRTLVFTDPARDDLDSIYDFIANDSPTDAERFVKRLVAELARLAKRGVTGAPRDKIRPGLRSHPYGRYCAYFRVNDQHLVVVRIIHSARDIDAKAFDTPDH